VPNFTPIGATCRPCGAKNLKIGLSEIPAGCASRNAAGNHFGYFLAHVHDRLWPPPLWDSLSSHVIDLPDIAYLCIKFDNSSFSCSTDMNGPLNLKWVTCRYCRNYRWWLSGILFEIQCMYKT